MVDFKKATKKAKVVNPKPSTDLATAPPAQVPDRISVQPVSLVDQGSMLTNIEGLPEEYKKGETLVGFPPSPNWERAGQTLFGDFIIMRTEVGPNASRLYEIAAYQGQDKEPLTVAVWGSAALDRLFDSAYPPIQTGDKLAIVYLGEKPTKRGLNPVKLFALRVVRASGVRHGSPQGVEKLHAS